MQRPLIKIAMLLIIIVSCTKKNTDTIINNFPKGDTLEGTQVFEGEYSLMYIKQIDSLFIISTAQDTLIHIFSKNGQLISKFGRLGRGPNEFSLPVFVSEAFEYESEIKLFTYDSQLKKLSSIDLTTSIDSNKVMISNEYEFPSELSGARDIFWDGKGNLIGVYDDHFSKRLDEKRGGFQYDTKDGSFETFELINLSIKPNEVMPATNINARIPTISPDRSKFATVLAYIPIIEIYDLKLKKSDTYYLGERPTSYTFDLDKFKNDELIEYYTFINSTEKYLYLLYVGQPYSDFPRESKIQVMTWDGQPVMEYLIPQEYGLGMFTVNESDSIFYGLSYDNDAIYRFPFGGEK